MKKILLGVLALFILGNIVFASTNVFTNPGSKTASVDNDITIGIDIDTNDTVYAFDVKLSFNSSVLTAKNLTEGEFLGKDGENTFIGTKKIDNQNNFVQFSATRFGTPNGVSGEGELFSVIFRTENSGYSLLDLFDVDISDQNTDPIIPSKTNGNVYVNRGPTIESVYVTPAIPKTSDALQCNFVIEDDSWDEVKANVTWFKNENPWTNDNENNIQITPGDTEITSSIGDIEDMDTNKHENWTCKVIAFDTKEKTSQSSDAVNVKNTKPTAPVISVSPDNPYTNNDLTCNIITNSQDEDGDTVNYIYEWYKDGTLQNDFTSETINSVNTQKEETWTCKVTPNDGESDGDFDSDQAAILNSKPTAENVTFHPEIAYTTDSLIANYEYSDKDGDSESGTEIRWYKNGNLQTDKNDQTVISSPDTKKGEQWYFTVKPKDGSEFGTLKTSETLTIRNTAPVIENVKIKTGDSSDELKCVFKITDENNDEVRVNITWFRNDNNWVDDNENGIEIVLGDRMSTTSKGNIESENIKYKENWTCQVTAFDDQDAVQGLEKESILTNIFLEPGHYTAPKGSMFSVDVEINSSDNIYGADFKLNFNSSILNVTSAVEGDYLKKDGSETNEVIKINNTKGEVTFGNTRIGTTESISGYGSLLTVNFMAKKEGHSIINLFDVDVVNNSSPNPESVFSAVNNGNVTVILLPGDVDKDCEVDIFDLAAIGLAYRSNPGDSNWNPSADVHPNGGNGKIDIFDLAFVGLHYGDTCSA